jgi:hypothetical protein
MDGRDDQQRERQVVIQHAYREELVERIGRAVREDGVEEPLPGLHLARSSVSLQPVHSVVEPSICVIAQGSKEVLLGESRYCYDPAHYLLTTVALPRVSQVLSASKEHPSVSAWTWLLPWSALSPLRQTIPGRNSMQRSPS